MFLSLSFSGFARYICDLTNKVCVEVIGQQGKEPIDENLRHFIPVQNSETCKLSKWTNVDVKIS
jgi:hypothetical protein